MTDTAAIAAWLIDGARTASRPEDVLAQLCDRLVAAGLPLWRVGVFVLTLHPEIMGRRFLWQPGSAVTIREAPFEFAETEEFRNSPVVAVRASRQRIRRRLVDPNCPMDFQILHEFRAAGATDYTADPLFFSDGTVQAVTWSTRAPGGFSDAQLAGLEALLAPLARVAEIYALRRTAINLLDTYVGHHAGERILAGRIRRGYVEAIQAAIWLSDMRGFTALAERLAPQALIDLLNRYFDCQVSTIAAQGGEVLKFMGDGLLAIFPLDGGDAGAACRRALASARDARAGIGALTLPGDLATGGVRFGLALHVGEVMYGNIGGGNRLDFTSIGPAVNLTARLEHVAAERGRTIVASADFARHTPDDFIALGEAMVAGFAAAQTVYALRDDPAV